MLAGLPDRTTLWLDRAIRRTPDAALGFTAPRTTERAAFLKAAPGNETQFDLPRRN